MSGGVFGIGTGEILLIVVIILLVMGPERLPQLARMWGRVVRTVGKFSNTWNQMNAQIARQVDEEARPVRSAVRLENASPAPVKPDATQEPDSTAQTIAPPQRAAAITQYPETLQPDRTGAPQEPDADAESTGG